MPWIVLNWARFWVVAHFHFHLCLVWAWASELVQPNSDPKDAPLQRTSWIQWHWRNPGKVGGTCWNKQKQWHSQLWAKPDIWYGKYDLLNSVCDTAGSRAQSEGFLGRRQVPILFEYGWSEPLMLILRTKHCILGISHWFTSFVYFDILFCIGMYRV